MGTLFASVYNCFLNKITDDMYMELTPEDTIRDLQNLLINAIPGFEFPRKKLEYKILTRELNDESVNVTGFVVENADGIKFEDASSFGEVLTLEEVNILAILMMEGWLQRQITTIELVRQKYSGTDFKFTSQAAHLAKLLALLAEVQRQSLHMQRLYKRRKTGNDGYIKSNWSSLAKISAINGYRDIDDFDADPGNTFRDIIYKGGII